MYCPGLRSGRFSMLEIGHLSSSRSSRNLRAHSEMPDTPAISSLSTTWPALNKRYRRIRSRALVGSPRWPARALKSSLVSAWHLPKSARSSSTSSADKSRSATSATSECSCSSTRRIFCNISALWPAARRYLDTVTERSSAETLCDVDCQRGCIHEAQSRKELGKFGGCPSFHAVQSAHGHRP
jgi:hypothetical protein